MLLSSHILSEVEALCDRVSIIRAGRTVESGTLAELRHLTRTSDHRRAGRAARRPRPAAGRARPARSTGDRVRFDVDTDQLGRGAAAARRRRRAQPDQPAADAGGAVPAPLHRRTRRRGEGVMTGDDARTPADSGTLRSPKSTGNRPKRPQQRATSAVPDSSFASHCVAIAWCCRCGSSWWCC